MTKGQLQQHVLSYKTVMTKESVSGEHGLSVLSFDSELWLCMFTWAWVVCVSIFIGKSVLESFRIFFLMWKIKIKIVNITKISSVYWRAQAVSVDYSEIQLPLYLRNRKRLKRLLQTLCVWLCVIFILKSRGRFFSGKEALQWSVTACTLFKADWSF